VKSATPNPYLPRDARRTSGAQTNLNGLHFAGVEASFTWIPNKSQKVRIEWTALHGAQTALHGLESEYVFNYPVENIHASWSWAMGHDIVLTNAVQLAERYQQTVYPVWNATLTRDAWKVRPYLRLTNRATPATRRSPA
jgi:hypothetical protein